MCGFKVTEQRVEGESVGNVRESYESVGAVCATAVYRTPSIY